MSDETLTTEEVCAMLGGITPMTLSRMVRSGRIHPLPWNPVLERPKRYGFARSEVQRVLAQAQAKREQERQQRIAALRRELDALMHDGTRATA